LAVNILIVYPHGLGDCILSTPVLRALKKRGDRVGFATQERFRSAKLLDACPYVDDLFYTKDAWNDYPSFEVGCTAVKAACDDMARSSGYENVVMVSHGKGVHKITSTAEALGVKVDDVRTGVFLTDEDMEIALQMTPAEPYGFVQTNTGVPSKDLPPGWGRQWTKEVMGIDRTVEVGVDFGYDEIPIGVQFLIMSGACSVCVPDSVFFHAACAMGKRVDLAYFARGKKIYDVVRPLHEAEYEVVWSLPKLEGF
jgi:hypothetical protein